MEFTGFNTKAVHAGDLKIPQIGNVVTPIFENSTFIYPNSNEDAYTDNTRNLPYVYSRWGNPTIQSLEEKYKSLENCDYSLAFSSGMAAISSVILSVLKKGDNLLAINELYGQTYGLFSKSLKNYGINVDFISVDNLNNLNIGKKNYKAIYIESVTNPLLEVPDILKISKYCKENNMILIDDATFASPYNQKPVDLGVDIVVHSGTKYIAGHSDLLLGLAGTSSKEYYDDIVNARKTFGAIPDAFQSYLAYRGLKTLGLRMEKHNENGNKISDYLYNSDYVAEVYYPGLKNNKYHNIAVKNLKSFGGMISFKLNSNLDAHKFIKNLEIPSYAASLGGVESLITLPVETSHLSLTAEEREKTGITENLIRLSLGIEDYNDIISDFDNSFKKL